MAITNYPNLRNQNGTIVDKVTGKRYSSPAQLAADLGIAPDNIKWEAIAKENVSTTSPVYTPPPTPVYEPSSPVIPPTPIPNYNTSQNNLSAQNIAAYQQANPITSPSITPVPVPTTETPKTETPIIETPKIPDTGDPILNQLLSTVQSQLDSLVDKGQTINPKVEITPEKTAEFLTQAQKEISPYYASQMKIAREGLLRQAGYTSDEIAQQEAKIEKTYGKNLRQLSSNMAESGFALSGERQMEERNLAEDTQSTIESARKAAEYNAGNSARQFASEWGGTNVPGFSYGAAPKVNAGQEKFSRSLDMTPFYSISDSVLSGLTGSQQYNEQAQTKSRASELEGLYRTKEANRQRSLLL